ncbi:peroxisomal membrane anchor protein conserved region-domain-containing protein [Podospora didyma]|uniref:Peroxisomal membrane protein PEX14 n=1 Tax=Podospora didyma TaxID=330526 RepID=A0AAE0NH45_9PEZI|nr:peroxisomal membrane anchor protein conserved region-domain-containing protein [Podospora didyma]
MAIREDLVASAANFLKDPQVASSPIETRIAFLQAKNLTQEEVSAALARVGPETAPPPQQAYPPQGAAPSQAQAQAQAQPYYGQYPPHYPPYAWPQPPQEPPRRDWRDWFIMATVVGGVSYGLFNLGKRYIYPLVAPPTPERLELDKKSIDEQFEKTFALVDQLAKDTEALKAAEQERTQRLDSALGELETVINDLKSANRHRDNEAQRVRDDLQNLKESIPRAMDNQKELTDTRLREVNTDLKSLKTLITQRMNLATAPSPSGGNYLRQTNSNATPAAVPVTTGNENKNTSNSKAASGADQPKPESSSFGRSSPFSSGMSQKASIPAWQLMASKNAASTAAAAATAPVNGTDSGSDTQEATGSS